MASHLEGPEAPLLVILEVSNFNIPRKPFVYALENWFAPRSRDVVEDQVVHIVVGVAGGSGMLALTNCF